MWQNVQKRGKNLERHYYLDTVYATAKEAKSVQRRAAAARCSGGKKVEVCVCGKMCVQCSTRGLVGVVAGNKGWGRKKRQGGEGHRG